MKQKDYILIGIGILVLLCLYIISKSYKNKYLEGFNEELPNDNIKEYSYTNMINTLNKNKNNLNNIKSGLQLNYLQYPDTETINKYVPADTIINSDDKRKLKQQFNLNFRQHLQNKEIQKLEKDLEYLKNKKGEYTTQNQKNIIKGLKGITTGSLLKMGYNTDDKTYDFISKPKFSLVVEEKEDSAKCISYLPEKNINDNGEIETVKTIDCNYDLNANNQKFSYIKIEGNQDFNNALHPDNKQYEIADYYQLNNYPFYIIHPYDNTQNNNYTVNKEECLTLNSDGLSVEPCNLKQTQRFLLSDLSY